MQARERACLLLSLLMFFVLGLVSVMWLFLPLLSATTFQLTDHPWPSLAMASHRAVYGIVRARRFLPRFSGLLGRWQEGRRKLDVRLPHGVLSVAFYMTYAIRVVRRLLVRVSLP